MKQIKKLWYPKLLVTILRATFGVFLKKYYNITFIDNENIINLKGPFIIIANHVNFWDPFFISDYLKQEIHYITSDNIFRDPIFKYFMRLFGSIPKSKFIPDTQTIRLALKVINKGASIGLFPEGNRTWDGNNLSIVESTGKLIKLLGIPLIGAKIKGAYLTLPRWAEKKRKGKVIIEFSKILSKEEIKEMTVNQINDVITKWIKHSDDDFQSEKEYKYLGKNLAHFLEQILFICPKCKSFISIYSKEDNIKCKNCSLDIRYNENAKFESHDGFEFKTVSSWNRWQIKYFFDYLKNLLMNSNASSKKEIIILKDPHEAEVNVGYKYYKMNFLTNGYIILKSETFEIYSKDTNKLLISFNIENMEGINVQNKEVLEFYYDNKLYRIFYKNKRVSTYKWLITLLIIKKIKLLEKENKNKISIINIDNIFSEII